MNSTLRTGIIFGAVLAAALAGISVALTALDMPAGNAPGEPSDPAGLVIPANAAPGLVGIAHYINTTPDELDSAIDGSVVLYDIWTYSCINCVRTLPYITSWHEKYEDDGLLIIGVHSPEFEFEKDLDNVKRAVQKHGITYPVVMDNDMETWDAFENRYWPRKYIADHEGNIRYDHIGEGDYENTERVIQRLLEERARSLGEETQMSTDIVDIESFTNEGYTRELYFGYAFAYGRNQLGNGEGFVPQADVTYTIPDRLERNHFYVGGTWTNLEGSMRLVSDTGTILLPYHAKQVNIVAGADSAAEIEVYVDSAPVAPEHAGEAVSGHTARIDGHGVYNIIDSPDSAARTLELRISEPGFEMFTFTFG